ncbi:DUF3604 domain-containing protein [Maioricimonas sp. JC845]|uniref:DUF3604 domain-containing protein n=1 Tax=Maioricimonas sp. JC845 TaxID=3232138 RepID=UPI00345999DB
MAYELFWGDLHSHCSISYGHGTVEQALARAAQQLDFCSVTGHAFWPDMPTDRQRYAEIIDYHNEGFATLAGNWDRLIELQRQASHPGQFLALPSYEWHSLEFGDHNVYAPGPELPLRDAPDLPGLRDVVRESGGIAIPHHIGYRSGYRGINWDAYREEVSPFVEIFSLHGCSLSDDAPWPMLHDMGPRDAGSTAEEGWRRGHRFGIVGGTDHHAAYPGSHGDGRMGVFAKELTRESLWEAFLARRVYAATGDRIDARMFVDGAWIGETVRQPGRRTIPVAVKGADTLDRVELLRNGRIVRRWHPEMVEPDPRRHRYRLRVTWGWGRKEVPVEWNLRLSLSDGRIAKVETLFSGQAIVAPKGTGEGESNVLDEVDLPHAVIEQDERTCVWRSITTGNKTMRHETTQGMSFELEGPLDARLTVEANGQVFEYTLAELLRRGQSRFLRGWLTEAIRIGPLVPVEECRVEGEFVDEPESDVDVYRLQVAQRNGQWAWLTPVWVDRE